MTEHRDKDSERSNTYPPESNDVEKRRRAIEKLIGGVGAIGTVKYWSSPVVHSVVLPAHAQTSQSSPPPPPPP